MKIYRVLGVILVALCFFACNSNKENEYEYQPLTIDNYAEVSLGDTTNLIITGGSGNIVVEGKTRWTFLQIRMTNRKSLLSARN